MSTKLCSLTSVFLGCVQGRFLALKTWSSASLNLSTHFWITTSLKAQSGKHYQNSFITSFSTCRLQRIRYGYSSLSVPVFASVLFLVLQWLFYCLILNVVLPYRSKFGLPILNSLLRMKMMTPFLILSEYLLKIYCW